MAFFPSVDSVFQINDGTSLRDITPYIISIDMDAVRELIEVTALGDGGRKWIAGLEDTKISLELHWSDDASVGSETVMRLIRDDTVARAFDYGPEGKATGDNKYSGTCWVRNYRQTSRVGNEVTSSVEIQVEGILTVGTYT